MTTASSDIDVEEMDDYERSAKERLEPILGPLRLIDRRGGTPGLHDFEADLQDGSVAAIEVTSEVQPERLAQESEIMRQGIGSFQLPSLSWAWVVRLSATARVRAVGPPVLGPLLGKLEAAGRSSASDRGDVWADPFVQPLRDLGIAFANGVPRPRPGREGMVTVDTDTYGGFSWFGSTVDIWLSDLLASPKGVNKLVKLARAIATERYLVVVLDEFSAPGLGIWVGLISRHERGSAGYVMPSVEPPVPVTHLWLIPKVAAREGLVWTRAAGWYVLSSGGT